MVDLGTDKNGDGVAVAFNVGENHEFYIFGDNYKKCLSGERA